MAEVDWWSVILELKSSCEIVPAYFEDAWCVRVLNMMVLFMIGCAFVSYGLLNIGILAGVLLPGDVVLWRSSLS